MVGTSRDAPTVDNGGKIIVTPLAESREDLGKGKNGSGKGLVAMIGACKAQVLHYQQKVRRAACRKPFSVRTTLPRRRCLCR